MYEMVLVRWKEKSRSGSKQLRWKIRILHTHFIPVSYTVLGLFKTPEDVVAGLNRAVQLVEDDKIQIKDKKNNVKQQYLIMKQCSAQEQYTK